MTADFPIPAGYALVPLEPTLAMKRAGLAERHDDLSASIYKAMLAAAPPIAAVVGEPVAEWAPRPSWDRAFAQLEFASKSVDACQPANALAMLGNLMKELLRLSATSATDPAAVVGVEASPEPKSLKFWQDYASELAREVHSLRAALTPSQALPVAAGEAVAWLQSKPAPQPCAPGAEYLTMTDAWKRHLLSDPSDKFAIEFANSHDVPLYAGSPPTAREPKPLDDPRLQELFTSCIDGALTTGYQGGKPPPEGHWLAFWWKKGQGVATVEEGARRASTTTAREPLTEAECMTLQEHIAMLRASGYSRLADIVSGTHGIVAAPTGEEA